VDKSRLHFDKVFANASNLVDVIKPTRVHQRLANRDKIVTTQRVGGDILHRGAIEHRR
jgi:hypothetical protein